MNALTVSLFALGVVLVLTHLWLTLGRLSWHLVRTTVSHLAAGSDETATTREPADLLPRRF